MIRDRAAARSSLQRILEWDFDRVVVTHGENIHGLVGRTPGSGEIDVVEAGDGGALREIGSVPVAALG